MAFIRKQWFLLSLVLALVASYVVPELPLGDYQLYLKLGLVSLIFVCTGLAVRSRELFAGLSNWRLHVFIQGMSFLIGVLIALVLDHLWGLIGLLEHVRLGFLVLAALPTTITGCVILTTAAQGNVSAAVVNACLGNLLGVFITPLWIWYFSDGTQTEIDLVPVLEKLCWFVLLPLVIGQAIQWRFRSLMTNERRRRASICGQLAVVTIVFMSFQQAFATELAVTWVALVLTFCACVVFHGLLLLMSWYAALLPPFCLSEFDRRCALICASQKTLAFGLPLIALCYAGHPDMAVISLPILLYHPLQLLLAGWLASRLSQRPNPPA